MLIDELAQRREEKEAMLSRNNIGKKHKQADFQKEFKRSVARSFLSEIANLTPKYRQIRHVFSQKSPVFSLILW